MIKFLKINNFALAKNIEINFLDKSFNVLIGETGAGKTIILKSILFVLGEKFSKNDIRTGQDFVKVSAIFENISKKSKSILQKFGIPNTNEVLISRQADIKGKADCRINGEIVTLTMLKELGETLVSVYGQHENTLLLKVSNHLKILDSYKPEILKKYKYNLSNLIDEYKFLKANFIEFGGDKENRLRQLELLNYQINEITRLNPQPEEDIELENQINNIKNFEKISNIVYNAVDGIIGNASASEKIKDASKIIRHLVEYDEDYQKLSDKLESIYFDMVDIGDELNSKIKDQNFTQSDLERLDERLDEIKMLKKKYGSSIKEVIEFLDKAKLDKENLINTEEKIDEITKKLCELENKILCECNTLSNKRKDLAVELENKIQTELSLLGMKNTKLKVLFSKSQTFSKNGNDEIEFLFSANLGQDLKPLSKIISGGEMSRFMLALKNIISEDDNKSTLIFDEIDSGISGEIGSAIAEKIAILSKNNQIICITHLPQVCAMADNYIYVYKQVENNETTSLTNVLFGNDIILAISKLSGGDFSSQISFAHAQELKNWATNFKNHI